MKCIDVKDGDVIKILPYLDNGLLVWGKPHIILTKGREAKIFNVDNKIVNQLCIFDYNRNNTKANIFKKYYFNSIINGKQQTIRLSYRIVEMLNNSDIYDLNTNKHLVIVDKKVELGGNEFGSDLKNSYIKEFDLTIPSGLDWLDNSPYIPDDTDDLKSIFGEQTYNLFISEMRDNKISEILEL